MIRSLVIIGTAVIFALPCMVQAEGVVASEKGASAPPGWRSGIASESSSLESSGIKMLQGLALCGGVLCLGAWAYKKYVLKTPAVASRKMRIIERLPLSPKATLVLIEVEGIKKIVAMGSDPVSFHDLAEPESFSFDSIEHNQPTERECDIETSVT